MLPDPDALEALRTDLRSADPAIQARAVAQLGDVVGQSARDIVTEALASDNPEVREAAERLLARLIAQALPE
ncbi:MAG: HEAT repeat domain-containing protein [Coriobacteriia bacterium]|nr:HEAT repeat domain-containing protein [Coriobacteriia bacterium]